jgi:hypothetical protein
MVDEKEDVCENYVLIFLCIDQLIIDFSQELVYRGAALPDVLRLLVLLSLTWHGLPRKAYEAVREEVLVAYGHEHALTLTALERAGERTDDLHGAYDHTSGLMLRVCALLEGYQQAAH